MPPAPSSAAGARVAQLAGIVPPLVTPFRDDGALDLYAFEANLEAYQAADLGGYLVLGSNGEANVLSEDEKLALVEATRRRAAGRLVLAGTGVESTRGTIELTRKVAGRGADAALVLTPHYYKAAMTAEALRRHFEAVAEASPIPVLLYSVPAFTGLVFPHSVAHDLARHPNVAGMKESSGDLALMGRILRGVPEPFLMACGSAPVLYPALCLGARAGVLAVACCAPGPTAALYRAFERGDHARARELQRVLSPLAQAVTAAHGVAGLKRALTLGGLRGGLPRAPLLPAPPAVDAEIEPLLRAALDAAA